MSATPCNSPSRGPRDCPLVPSAACCPWHRPWAAMPIASSPCVASSPATTPAATGPRCRCAGAACRASTYLWPPSRRRTWAASA
eukprot:5756841-Pyramimonas_sp.AAC.1